MSIQKIEQQVGYKRIFLDSTPLELPNWLDYDGYLSFDNGIEFVCCGAVPDIDEVMKFLDKMKSFGYNRVFFGGDKIESSDDPEHILRFVNYIRFFGNSYKVKIDENSVCVACSMKF